MADGKLLLHDGDACQRVNRSFHFVSIALQPCRSPFYALDSAAWAVLLDT